MNNIRTSSVPSLTIRRTFKAARARVFAAFTKPEILREWFGPPGIEIIETRVDAREGGTFRIAMRNSRGEDYIVGGTFSLVRVPERLAYSFRWVEDDPADEIDTFITVEFIERDGETEMVFTQEAFRDAASRERHNEGWCATFDKLTVLL